MPNGNMLRMRSETDYAYSICALNTEERPARHASILQDVQTDQCFAGEFKVLKLMALAAHVLMWTVIPSTSAFIHLFCPEPILPERLGNAQSV